MKLSDYTYILPEDLIAQHPSKARDESRLMVVDRIKGTFEHRLFSDIIHYLSENDLLVFNNSKVIPARIFAKKSTGGKIELLLLKEIAPLTWEVLIKGSKIKEMSSLFFDDGGSCIILERYESGKALVRFSISTDFYNWLDKNGNLPLPPYIKRDQISSSDRERYQTIYAKKNGSVAAPTAGLHFTHSLKNSLSSKGVTMAYVTLHVGQGTFRPIRTESIEDHFMDSEHYEIDEEASNKIDKALAENRRIIGVGSTSVRTLETAIKTKRRVEKSKGDTTLFLYEKSHFNVIEGMLTNFHLPETTLFVLISAFAGKELIKMCYNEAIKEKYRFYSYGDSMLII